MEVKSGGDDSGSGSGGDVKEGWISDLVVGSNGTVPQHGRCR